jgi:UDP-N-acetylmuramoyl-L-alanyl-D-glutamate--2,6-diaminopimelate ligase
VDYAHTPDALKKALQALRPHTAGKLWVVFGCGGDRDQEKRPLMGKIAETYADYTIITDDNPRHEDPATIRSMVAMGAPSALIQDNRVLAIKRAITKAQPNDVILIAGKGHETTQQLGDQLISHDDKKIAAGFLAVDNPPKIAG